ncbi:hypothetical protein [Cellulomonas sp. FA1]|uniref:hypothetical protein n=1 Tax=Cellulomonas sp. FA1 TaxID=1346710 RepID=UPI0006258E94|nr:hypothetical protein [Cellulomonas sp. FA1]
MTKGSDWDVASDALAVERLLASSTDPVTHRATPVSLGSECDRIRSESAVLTVVALGFDTPTTRALPGRARGLDAAERVLCRDLERWADRAGSVVAIGEAAAAALVVSTPEDARTLRARLPELHAQLDRAAGPAPLVTTAQGPARDSSDVVARAVERMVAPRGSLPAQDPWADLRATRRPLWDATTGARFGTQVRLHAYGADGPHAERAEGLLAVTRSPRFADAAVATSGAVARVVVPDVDDGPVVWDATAVLSGTGPARGTLVQALLDRCPPDVWVGVAAWLADLPEVVEALRTLRARGHRVVLTGYGAGREPLVALDELPVDALLLDTHLERGARLGAEDHAVHAAVLEHAARTDVVALTAARGAVDRHRSPAPARAPRWADPGGEVLARARLLGLTLRETAVLVNATQAPASGAARWDRYDVAMHWARASS